MRKAAAHTCGSPPLGREGRLPGEAQIDDHVACQAELEVRQQQEPRPPVRGGGGAQFGGGPAQRLLEEAEAMLNGLFTNDKFCLSRFGQLGLTWWRYPLRLRGRHSDPQTASPGEVAHRGGSHETAVVHSPADVRPPRWAATLGPRVSGDPGVGGRW